MRPAWLDPVEPDVLAATGATTADELTGETLRHWGSSEVWRMTSASGRSVIVKRGTDSQTAEANAYEHLVIPLGLPAPTLFRLHRDADAIILVLADVGAATLEQQPSEAGYLAAAELLATIGACGAPGTNARPQRLDSLIEQIRDTAADDELLAKTLAFDEPALRELEQTSKPRVVHGDFVPKNLVSNGATWTAIDWPAAYVAPHLADLYTLTREARKDGVDPVKLVAHYNVVSGNDPVQTQKQLAVGGIWFTLQALAWIASEGRRTVPDSLTWIDGLLADLRELTTTLDEIEGATR